MILRAILTLQCFHGSRVQNFISNLVCNTILSCSKVTRKWHARGIWVVSNMVDHIDEKILLVTTAATLVILLKAEREEETNLVAGMRAWLHG